MPNRPRRPDPRRPGHAADRGATPAASPPPRASWAWCPAPLTYRVRQIEDALDVLLFDRSSRQATADRGRRRTAARRRAPAAARSTPWPTASSASPPAGSRELTIAVDSVISRSTVMELAQAFFALAPPTRLRLRDETLSGTLEALVSGQADLAIGVVLEPRQLPQACRAAAGRPGFRLRGGAAPPAGRAARAADRRRAAQAPRGGRGRLHRSAAAALTLGLLSRAGRADGADHAGQARRAAARPGRRLPARSRWRAPTSRPATWSVQQTERGRRASVRMQLRLARRAARPGRAARCNGGWRSSKAAAHARARCWSSTSGR